MKKFLMCIIFFGTFSVLHANPIRVAVIDTGLDMTYSKQVPLCRDGHKDFSGEGLSDKNGHGTNIVGLIVQNAKTNNYCIIIIKAYSSKKFFITEALEYANTININVINLSGGGLNPIIKERNAIMSLLKSKVTIVAAAGNEKMDLDKNCNYYPACYDERIYVIGSTSYYSNYGKFVDLFYDGKNKTGFGVTLSGTSQSAALFTADLLKQINSIQQKYDN